MTVSPEQILAKAVALHRQGKLAEAIANYSRVTRALPRHAGAWNLLGLATFQHGDHAKAESFLRRALQLDPKLPNALHNLGLILQSLGKISEASQCFEQIVRSNPNDAAARAALAVLLGRLDRHDEAISQFQAALRINPNDANVRFNLGNALTRAGRKEEALAEFRSAIALAPALAPAFVNGGKLLQDLGRHDEAIALFEKLVAVSANDPVARLMLGSALQDARRFHDAEAQYAEALRLDPKFAEAHVNLGNVALELGEHERACEHFNAALAIRSDAKAHFGLGSALQAIDRHDDALKQFAMAIDMEPDNATFKCVRASLAMALGRFGDGWMPYRVRWRSAGQTPPEHARDWDGESIARTLLVWGEQGLGDQIVYSSMINDLSTRAGEIVVEVDARLVPLFQRSFPRARIVPLADKPYAGSCDAAVALGDLGRFLRRDASSFSPTPYLKIDKERRDKIRQQLDDGRKIVGLSWGSTNPLVGHRKSASILDFAPLLSTPGFRFIDLQYGDTQNDRALAERELNVRIEKIEGVDNTNDLDGLAALMGACDAVVSVSNTNAHLAGATGARTFLLLSHAARPWYWFLDRDDSPWYPRMTILRQKRNQPWREVIAPLAEELGSSD